MIKLMKQMKNTRGFTLIEIMMTVAIMGIFLAIAYEFLGNNLKSLNERNVEHSSYLQARTAILRLTTDFQRFETLEVSSDILQGTVFGGTTPTKLINCSDVTDPTCVYRYDSALRRLIKSGSVMAENIDISIARLKLNLEETLDPSEVRFVRITIEAFPDNGAENTVKLSTTVRLDHKRPDLWF